MSNSSTKVPVRFVSSWEEGEVETAAMLDISSGEVSDIETSNDGESEHYESLIKEYIAVADGSIAAKVELAPNDEYRVASADDLEQLRAHFNYGMRAAAAPVVDRQAYMDHLCARIFERNDFGSTPALIAAINHATALPPETEWRARKHAFNEIGEKAPFGNGDGYLLKYEDVPGFLEQEADAFVRFFSAGKNQAAIPRFELLHSGQNQAGYRVEAMRDGDPGIYNELRVGVFDKDGGCVADVLVGLTEGGEPRVMLTAGGDGENEHAFAVYPLRDADEALEQLDAPGMKP